MMSTASAPTPLDRVVDALAAAGCNPKGGGRKRTARCPAHDDRNPSLSVAESDNGSALVYCHAGCTTADVAAALGLHLADLFPDKPPREAPLSVVGRLKAAYHYHDADGELIYRNVRYEPKTFRLERWDVTQFKPGLAGVKRVLYHLPQVRRAVATGRTIMILEGEKDVENAQWLDVVATTSGGATSWQDHYADDLAGASRVVVCVDDDPEGHAYGRAVVRSLRGRVGRLTVVRPTRGKDLTAHLAAGGTKTDLERLWDSEQETPWLEVSEEPAAVDDTDDRLLSNLIRWDEFWARDHSVEEWVAWPLVPAGRAVALYAPAKAGKSLLVLDVVGSVATGRPILGGDRSHPRHVLYLDYEMTQDDLFERLDALGYGPGDDLSHLHYATLPDLPPLDTKLGGERLARLAELVEAELIVVDTLGRAAVGEENNNDTVRNFYQWTGKRLKAARRAILRTDHTGKDAEKGQRGGSAKNDDVDVVWRLLRGDGSLMLNATHTRVPWITPNLSVTIREGETPLHVVAPRAWHAGTKELAAELDRLDVPLDASRSEARARLKAAGVKARNEVLGDALRWRQEQVVSDLGGDAAEGPF